MSAGRLANGLRALAALPCRLRWAVLVFWAVVTPACLILLPSIGTSGGALGGLVPEGAAALHAEAESAEAFAFPLLSRTIVVQHDPGGLPRSQQLRAVSLAQALTRGAVPSFRSIRAALPVTDALDVPIVGNRRATTLLTYLFFGARESAGRRTTIARRLVSRLVPQPPRGLAAVTGLAPAQAEQTQIVDRRLPWVELATALLVLLAMALHFRAFGPPLAALAAVGVSFEVSAHLVAWAGERAGISVPQDVEPVMVVLVLGVVTDYSVFLLTRCRSLLQSGEERLDAASRTAREISPIVLVAALTVVAGTVSLLIAHLSFFRAFGPALAATVLVCALVVLTLLPAVLACFGRAVFWPAPSTVRQRPEGANAAEQRARVIALACRHPWPALVACLVPIAAAAWGLHDLRLSNPAVRGLPGGAEARRAYRAATAAFPAGALSPTVVLADAPGIARARPALSRLQRLIAAQPGVALVLGPGQNPLTVPLGATIARSGNAARFVLILAQDPLGAGAISTLRQLEHRMPAFLRNAGLTSVAVSYAGDTALSAETVDDTLADLGRIAPVAIVAILLILAIFLRAMLASIYLVATGLLSFAAGLGLTSYVFDDVLGHAGIAFFVPFAVAVLLVSLGSDYNVFLLGRTLQEAQRRPFREAVPLAASRADRAIVLAGLILAGSFALLALIPLTAFQQIALAMTSGLLIDTLLVRTVLVPALMMIVGERSAWPRRLHPPPAAR